MNRANTVAFAFAFLLAGSVALAKDESDPAIKAALSGVPTAEVPAKAAELVFDAKPASRDAVAADVVRTAIKSKPALTLAVVGAVCQKSPESAPTVAATAAKFHPRQAKQIAQAAAAAAPEKATDIVKAVGKAVPESHGEVALVVSQVVPRSAKEILATAPSPAKTSNEPEAPVLANNNRPPTIGGPFVPISTTPTNVPSGGGVVPVGGRDYATP